MVSLLGLTAGGGTQVWEKRPLGGGGSRPRGESKGTEGRLVVGEHAAAFCCDGGHPERRRRQPEPADRRPAPRGRTKKAAAKPPRIAGRFSSDAHSTSAEIASSSPKVTR